MDSSTNLFYSFEKNKYIKGITVAFNETDFDESNEAKKLANAIGISHDIIICDGTSLNSINKIMSCFDEPNGDQAAMAVNFAMSQYKNRTYMISGEGGDEFLGLPRKYNHKEMMSIFENSIIYETYFKKIEYLNKNFRNYVYKKNMFCAIDLYYLPDFYCKLFDEVESDLTLHKIMYSQIRTWMCDNVLVKDTRMVNLNGMRAYFPLVNQKLAEFIFSINEKVLYELLNDKFMLKNMLLNKLPSFILRKEKHTFRIPIKEWIDTRKVSNIIFNELLNKENILWDYLDFYKIKFLVETYYSNKEDYSLQLWQIFVLATWLKNHY